MKLLREWPDARLLKDDQLPVVFAWAETHEGEEPLARAYLGLCALIGSDVIEEIDDGWDEVTRRVYEARDLVGRRILKLIAKNGWQP